MREDGAVGQLPRGLSDRQLFLLKRCQALLTTAIDEALAKLGIDVREFTVMTLVDSEGPRPQQRLSERLRIDRTTIVSLIDSLEEKGVVRRRSDPTDRRKHLIELTPRGRRLYERALLEVEAAEKAFTQALSRDEHARLMATLRTLVTSNELEPSALRR